MTNIGPSLRAALLAANHISSKLSTWEGEPAIFLRSPLPTDAGRPLINIPFDISYTDEDFINSKMPVIIRDIGVYGVKGAPGAADDQTRLVEQIGYDIRKLFHRNPSALGNPPFHVVSINASGPIPAPVEDDFTVGRIVSLTVRIQDGS